jgi:hypothetical protein
MNDCCLLLSMSLKYFILCILNNEKRVLVRERSLRVGLKVACPSLWVVGYVTVWYQSLWLKHQADMGQVCWSESWGRDRILTM